MRPTAALLALILSLAFSVAATAIAQDFPQLKAGQWETTTTSSIKPGTPPNKMTMCTDDAIQKQMMNMGEGMRREMCSKSDLRHEGGKYIGDSVCKIGDATMTSHSVMTIQGDTSYKTVVNATYDPPFMGMKETTTTIDGKNVGPCRDGLKPGDIVSPTGQKFNMKALADRPPALPPAKAK
jgi:Protein of unknown function (DUF3617)